MDPAPGGHDHVERAWRRAVHACPLPMAILDLVMLEVVDANEGALRFFAERDGHPVDVRDHIVLHEGSGQLTSLLVSGTLDSFETRLPAPRPGSPDGTVHVWMRSLAGKGDKRRFAVAVITEGGALDPSVRIPVARPSSMATGVLDDEWRCAWVSREVTALLGYSRDAFIGMPFLALIHPDMAADAVAALVHAHDDEGGSVLQGRIRRADGGWRASQILLSPRPLEAGVTFILLPNEAPRADDYNDLLWHAADQASLVSLASGSHLGSRTLPELSSRQWEIVCRLQRGERVPGIARTMYLSPSTVRNHLTAVFRKFGVNSQEELLAHLRRRAEATQKGRSA